MPNIDSIAAGFGIPLINALNWIGLKVKQRTAVSAWKEDEYLAPTQLDRLSAQATRIQDGNGAMGFIPFECSPCRPDIGTWSLCLLGQGGGSKVAEILVCEIHIE